VLIWYIFPNFDILYQEKSGKPVFHGGVVNMYCFRLWRFETLGREIESRREKQRF
jgi:hypothetical protein